MKTIPILIAVITLATGISAQAQNHSRTRIVTGPNGNNATRTIEGSYGGGAYDRSVSRTGSQGNVANRARTITPMPHGRVADVTGPRGNSYRKDVYRGPHGRVHATRFIGPNGNRRAFVRFR